MDYEKCYSTKKLMLQNGIDVNKTSLAKECELCHYWLFKNVGFKFEPHVSNRCHDLLIMAFWLENVAILSAKGATFSCSFQSISRNKALRRLNNSVLEDKGIL